jgi:hypothetical protein
MAKSKWIGMAEVRQHPGVKELGSNRGGFVTVVLLAEDCRDFEFRLRDIFWRMGFVLVKLEDVESYAERSSTHEIDEMLREGAEGVGSEQEIAFGRFHTFPLE